MQRFLKKTNVVIFSPSILVFPRRDKGNNPEDKRAKRGDPGLLHLTSEPFQVIFFLSRFCTFLGIALTAVGLASNSSHVALKLWPKPTLKTCRPSLLLPQSLRLFWPSVKLRAVLQPSGGWRRWRLWCEPRQLVYGYLSLKPEESCCKLLDVMDRHYLSPAFWWTGREDRWDGATYFSAAGSSPRHAETA